MDKKKLIVIILTVVVSIALGVSAAVYAQHSQNDALNEQEVNEVYETVEMHEFNEIKEPLPPSLSQIDDHSFNEEFRFLAQGPPPGANRGPGEGRPPGHPEMRTPVEINEAVIQEFENWIKQEDPERYTEIQKIKTANPEAYRRIVFEGVRHMRFVKTAQKNDPEAYARMREEMLLDRELRKLAEKFRQSKDETRKTALKREMKTLLEKQFDLRTLNREQEIKRLSQRVKELQELMEKRKAAKNTLVERRLEEITRGRDRLEW